MGDVGCCIFAITAHSPDLNPIENMFHLVRANLQKDTILERDNFGIFTFVRNIIKSLPDEILDKTIDSMPKRLAKIGSTKGERTKY